MSIFTPTEITDNSHEGFQVGKGGIAGVAP